jgi:three-Cys-motif partner protein
VADDAGLPVEQVGPWAKEKHQRLRRYVDISRATRRKWVQRGNDATYIDLYCGTGRAIIRGSGEEIDGSPLVAFKSARDGGVPFTGIYIADAAEESCRAAERRLLNVGGVPIVDAGPADQTAPRIVNQLNPYGLHFAFLDPYNLQDLPFSVIESFGRLKYIDMLIHVSAQDLQRNLHSYTRPGDRRLESFAPGWRKAVDLNQSQRAIRAAILDYWASKSEALGLPRARHSELVSGPKKNQRLYWLVFVSHSEFARRLWDKIRNLSGQGDLPL